jgi:excisionase family DNA binding protein
LATVEKTKISSPLLNVTEAAQYLNTSKEEIRHLVHTGAVRYVRELGKGWLILRADLDAWVARNLRTEGKAA